jgi:hypothetical protein
VQISAVSSRSANAVKIAFFTIVAIFTCFKALLVAARGSAAPSLGSPNFKSADFNNLVVPIAHIAREYTALNPQGSPTVLDTFLNTVWQAGNGNSHIDTQLIQQGGQELHEFLAGSEYVQGFSSAQQPTALDFIAKTLKFVQVSPQLTPQQKQNPDILRRWVSMARAYAQNRLSNGGGNSPSLPTYGINVSGYFLDTLWNTSLDNTGGIQKSVAQLASLMGEVNIDDQIRFVETSTKVQKALNYAIQKLPAELAKLIIPFASVLVIFAVLFAAAQAVPGLNLLLDAGVALASLALTAITGASFIGDFFSAAVRIAQADVNDEGELHKAGDNLASAMINSVGLIPGVAGIPGAISKLSRVLKLFSVLKLVDGAGSAIALFKLLGNFGKNETLLSLLDRTAKHPYLSQVVSRIGQSPEVLDALIQVKGDARLLEEVLKLGPSAIEDLAVILSKGADASQVIRLRFNVPGMTLAELRKLLSLNGMTPNLLEQLLGKLNNSLSTFKSLLNQCPNPVLLESLLSQTGNDPQLLLKLLSKYRDPTLLESLLLKNGTTQKALQDLLNKRVIPGVDIPFRPVNPQYPPNQAVLGKAEALKDEVRAIRGIDCSEIAEDLLDAAQGQGQIIEVRPSGGLGKELTTYEYGRPMDYFYHQVYTDGRYVYDPRLSSYPVPKGDWEAMIRGLNPRGLIFNYVK